MSDDDLFPPEETTASRSSELLGNLFGSSTTQKREKKSIEDLFGPRPATVSGTNLAKKRPTVTFQDPPVTNPKPTVDFKPPSTDLLDSLFSGGGSRRTRQNISAPTQQQPQVDTVSVPQPEISSFNSAELENLRREISTLRYEKNEDQETIRELRSENRRLQDDHKREIDELNRKHRSEIESLERKHVEEIKQLQKTEEIQTEILNNIKNFQIMSEKIEFRLNTIQDSSTEVQDNLSLIKNKTEDTEKIIEFANNQITVSKEKLQNEIRDFEKKQENITKYIEKELEKLSKLYQDDIITGRRWIQKERDKIYAEKRAFQEEQINVINNIEKMKENLENTKSEFLKKEHDLLVRVVNERSILEQKERQFEIQRNFDIIRIRKEAQELEVCFTQIQNALFAIEQIRKDYEIKNRNLVLNFEIISKYLPGHVQKQLMSI